MIERILAGTDLAAALTVPVRAGLAALTAWALVRAAGEPLIARLKRAGVSEKTEKTPIEDSRLRRAIASKSGTPTMGGLILLAGLLAGCGAWADLTSPLLPPVLGCVAAMAALGLADDWLKLHGKGRTERGLKVRHKLLAQGAAGAALALVLLRQGHGLRGWALPAALAWGALVVATMSNATNVTDGLDGLLAGLAAPAAAVLGGACWVAGTPAVAARLGITHVSGAAELAVFCASLAGACAGFLHFNRHPARVFMGDTGAMAVGGALAAVGLAAGQEVVMALAGLVFLAEFGSSLLQIGAFRLLGRRVLPVAPMHHIFQRQGYPEPRIVMGFYLAGAAAALIGLTSIGL
ncbi:MAG: phospho-N-acetylmuramoyl-pentapeptide-transferase [Candidatus Brocadiia bacterium]